MSFRIPHSAFRTSLAVVLSLGLCHGALADQIRQRGADGAVKTRNGKIKEVTKEQIVLQLTPTEKTDNIPANPTRSSRCSTRASRWT
jgi:hypothetical protein